MVRAWLLLGLLPQCSGAGESRPSLQPDAAGIAQERTLNFAAYRDQYLPHRDAATTAYRNQWLVVAGGKLLPAWRERDWRPFADLAAADAAAARHAPAAKHRFVWRIGEEGDQDIDVGGCERVHILGNAWGIAAGLNVVHQPGELVRVALHGGQEVPIGVPGPDNRSYLRPTLAAPLGPARTEELYCVSSGSTNSVLMRAPVADTLSLHLWEIPGEARVSGALCPHTVCRRALVRMVIRADGFALDRVFHAEVWPDDRGDGVLERK